eukprot:Sspe_Gene.115085::Locus_101979_Transcript_1_1_Confidence_1.000_Length_815::g.115085::m.115085/K00799/GST, gst; glutathione S-transferase
MLKLYHVPGWRSTRVLWLWLELQQVAKPGSLPELEVHQLDGEPFRVAKPQWYLEKVNANGKVPALVDENTGVTMFESGAIATYLLDRYDTDGALLSREDPKQRAEFFQMAFYSTGTLDNLTATSSPVQRAVLKEGTGPDEWAAYQKKVNRTAWDTVCAPMLEERLTKGGPFLLGETFSAVDVMVAHSLYGVHDKQILRKLGPSWLDGVRFPLLDAYYQRICERSMRTLAYKGSHELPVKVVKVPAAVA